MMVRPRAAVPDGCLPAAGLTGPTVPPTADRTCPATFRGRSGAYIRTTACAAGAAEATTDRATDRARLRLRQVWAGMWLRQGLRLRRR